jgi:hypothetical protein
VLCACPGLCAAPGTAEEPHAHTAWSAVTLAGGSCLLCAGERADPDSCWDCATADGVGANASFRYVHGMAWDYSAGALLVAETDSGCLRHVYENGTVDTVYGSCSRAKRWAEGALGASSLSAPIDLLFATTGALVIADAGGKNYANDGNADGRVRYMHPALTGNLTTLAGGRSYRGSVTGLGADASFAYLAGLALAINQNERGRVLAEARAPVAPETRALDGEMIDAPIVQRPAGGFGRKRL